jgi:hypothetical protein
MRFSKISTGVPCSQIYNNFCKDRNLRHVALVGLNISRLHVVHRFQWPKSAHVKPHLPRTACSNLSLCSESIIYDYINILRSDSSWSIQFHVMTQKQTELRSYLVSSPASYSTSPGFISRFPRLATLTNVFRGFPLSIQANCNIS